MLRAAKLILLYSLPPPGQAEVIFTAQDETFSCTMMLALNVATRDKTSSMTKKAAEELVHNLVRHQWLRMSPSGRLFLTPRSLLELEPWLKEQFPEHVLECAKCHDIVTKVRRARDYHHRACCRRLTRCFPLVSVTLRRARHAPAPTAQVGCITSASAACQAATTAQPNATSARPIGSPCPLERRVWAREEGRGTVRLLKRAMIMTMTGWTMARQRKTRRRP